MNVFTLDGEWEDGVLYKIILVQQELSIFAEYDYSAQWDLIEKALVMDYKQEKLFSFVHPKNGKKAYQRKHTRCPANGNTELAVGTMVKPLDFARALIVLHSHMYKVPYIVLERYRHISSNPDVMAKMIERAFNWVLEGSGVKVILERWDTKGEIIQYHRDFARSWDIELNKSEGEYLVRMGCEDAFEVHKRKEAKKKKPNKKSDDIRYYIQRPNKETIIAFIHKSLVGMTLPKDIARPFRVLREHKVFLRSEDYRLPYNAFIKAFPEFKDLISEGAYNDCLNPNRTSYDGDEIYYKLEKESEMILQNSNQPAETRRNPS